MNQPPSEPTGPRETAATIEQAAAGWVARRDRGPLSDVEEQALERWAAGDPRRAGAYARALAVNLHLDRIAALGADYAVDATPHTTRRRVVAAAAGAVAATGLGLFAWVRHDDAPAAPPIATAKGVTRRIGLDEGSRITLNTMTALRPVLTSNIRRIELLRGEALFDVAKDPNRPFVVGAGDLAVRAVGTSFTVRRTAPDAIHLLVTEGIVEVTRGADVLGQVHAGIAFAVATATSPVITTLDPVAVGRALAWREGRIDLHGMTLGEAAAEFARYSDLRIAVPDPRVGAMRIAGLYATRDAQGFAENAALSLGLRSVRRGDTVILSRE